MNKYHLSLGSDFRCCLKPRGSGFSISQRYDIKKGCMVRENSRMQPCTFIMLDITTMVRDRCSCRWLDGWRG